MIINIYVFVMIRIITTEPEFIVKKGYCHSVTCANSGLFSLKTFIHAADIYHCCNEEKLRKIFINLLIKIGFALMGPCVRIIKSSESESVN